MTSLVDAFAAAVLDTSVAALHAAGHEVRVTDLYAEGFDPVFSAHDHEHHLDEKWPGQSDQFGFPFRFQTFRHRTRPFRILLLLYHRSQPVQATRAKRRQPVPDVKKIGH